MDDSNPDGRPWLPGAGEWFLDGQIVPIWDRGDRISTTVINAAMTPDFSGNIPIFSWGLGGLILSPDANRLLCSYSYDVDSLERTCQPRGESALCTPGYSHESHPGSVLWCTSEEIDQWPCAWRPTDIGPMLRTRERLRRVGEKPQHKRFDDRKFYMELIFSAAHFIGHLPSSIEAVFFMKVDQSKWECPACVGTAWPEVEPDCVDATSGPKCRSYAIRAWRAIMRHFHLTPSQLPLLRFDPFNWKKPFEDMSHHQGMDG